MGDDDTHERPEHYRRHLPHWQPGGAVLFVTYRLADSLPAEVLIDLREQRARLIQEPMRRNESCDERRVRIDKQMLAHFDDRLVGAPSPKWLANRDVAAVVHTSLKYWDGERYLLRRYVIMPNHVHMLIEPLPERPLGQASGLSHESAANGETTYFPLPLILRSIKGFTAREANKVLARSGRFWQDESYDRWARNEAEVLRIANYIDANPVRAGLCNYPHEWEWSSAYEEEA